MIVVLPVCHKDIEAAQRNLRWCIELDKRSDLRCVVTHDTSLDAKPVLELAASYFSSVAEYIYRPPTAGEWPIPQNIAFQQSAARIFAVERVPWFWWEQDAVPLKTGWLEILRDEYEFCKRPFMGALSSTEHGNHLNGVAIYPPNLPWLFPDMMVCRNGPFDVVCGKHVLEMAHVTNKMQHVWSFDGKTNESPAPSFTDGSNLNRVEPTAVIFHRCKDGSLIDRLRSEDPQIFSDGKYSEGNQFLILGRHGDLINLFPVFESSALDCPTKVVTTREFTGLFDGVSYIEPEFLDLPVDQLANAKAIARERYPQIKSVQVWGDKQRQWFTEKHYNQDAWKMAKHDGFNDRSLRPVFDARSPKREYDLCRSFITDDRPIILLALQGGYSSPFTRYRELETPLRQMLKDYQLIDLCRIKAERIFDFLGLMDRATALITADSVHLHLAAATNVKTAALLSNRTPWAQTAPRCNVYWSEVTDAAIHKVKALAAATLKLPAVCHQTDTNFIHVVEPFWKHRIEDRRFKLSWQSWFQLYRTNTMLAGWVGFKPVRTSLEIGDSRKLTYMKELLWKGVEAGLDSDVLVWTNSDNILSVDVIDKLSDALAKTPVVTSRRIDYETSTPHPGRDLAAFKISWLKENWNRIPDFILGAPEFDVWMALQARHVLGIHSTAKQLMYDLYPADLEPGQVLHVSHGVPVWDGSNRMKLVSNLHNLKLLRDWCDQNNSDVKFNRDGTVNWNK